MYLNHTISNRNNQAFLQYYSQQTKDIINTLSEWSHQGYSKIGILNYIIKNVSCYGVNSHPSQTTIGKHAGVKRGWVNIVTNELVAMGVMEKTRTIIDGNETACEYALTSFFKDPVITWALKDILPALKLFSIFKNKEVPSIDNTPYIDIYFKKNFKILRTKNKSTSRKQLAKLSKLKDDNCKREQRKNMKDVQMDYDWRAQKEYLMEQQRKKEEEEKIVLASQDEGFVNFLQGLLNDI